MQALKDIFRDAQLDAAFRANGIVLMREFDVQTVETLKKDFNFPFVYIAYKSGDFPGMRAAMSPAIFFLRDGKVAYQYQGWGDTSREEARKGMRTISLLAPDTAADQSAQTASGPSTPPMLMKELLKDVPGKARADFISSLFLADGKIIAFPPGTLIQTQGKDKADAIIKMLAHTQGNQSGPPAQGKMVKINTLLKNEPEKLRGEFLDNLMFRNTAIVSAYTVSLRKTKKDNEIKNLLKAIFPKGSQNSASEDKIQCADGICYDAVCADNPPASGPPYIVKPGWACSAACGLY